MSKPLCKYNCLRIHWKNTVKQVHTTNAIHNYHHVTSESKHCTDYVTVMPTDTHYTHSCQLWLNNIFNTIGGHFGCDKTYGKIAAVFRQYG